MKNINLLLLCFMGSILSACTDIIEVGTDGRVSYEVVFSNNNLISGYLNQCYSYLPKNGMSYASNNFFGVFTDEAHDAETVLPGSVSLFYYNGIMTSNNNYMEGGSNTTIYDKMFTAIRSCNIFIDHIDQAQNLNVQSNRNRWKGEAYTLRAFYFWHLIKRFGPLPIIKHELPTKIDSASLIRPTFYKCVQAIMQDCDSALAQPNLEWRTSIETDRGSMTKSVAVAIKSEAILYAASPQWNTTPNITVWKEAATVTKDALDSLAKYNFSLYNPKDAAPSIKAFSDYQRLFLLKPEIGNPTYDKETIYAQTGQLANVWQQNGPPMTTDVLKAGTCPSQELVDAYETVNGMPILNPVKPYLDADHLQPNYNAANTQYDKTKPYVNRDPRLLSTIFCNGSNFNLTNNTKPVYTTEDSARIFSLTNHRYTPTGYYLRKFSNYNSNRNSNVDGYWRYFRMAEMYLNYAEAEYSANGVTTAAVDALNKTRLRAGLPALPYTISKTEFMQRLINERRVELAFEEHRYFDVRRWKIQSQVEGLVTGMSITGMGTFTYNRVVISRRSVTEAKYMLWPIPVIESGRITRISHSNYQNSGW